MATANHTSAAGAGPHVIIAATFHALHFHRVYFVEVKQAELWVLLGTVYHSAHFVNKRLHLLLGHIQLVSEVPILPLQLIVLVLQLLLIYRLFMDFRIILLLLCGSLPLPLDLGCIILSRLADLLFRLLYLLIFSFGSRFSCILTIINVAAATGLVLCDILL